MKILFAVMAYLFGAIPSGFLLYKLVEKKDIRSAGSRNIGATNVIRLKGWKFGIPVALFDILKGFLPAFLAVKIFDDYRFALICAFLAILGHCFPVYIKFKGGKGVATTLGAFAALAFKPLLLGIGLFILVVALTRYVSLGSLAAVLSIPFWMLLFKEPLEGVCLGIVVFIMIAFRHNENIRRLLKRNERKWGVKE